MAHGNENIARSIRTPPGGCVCAGGRPQAGARMTMDLVAAADEGDSNEGASEKPGKFHLRFPSHSQGEFYPGNRGKAAGR